MATIRQNHRILPASLCLLVNGLCSRLDRSLVEPLEVPGSRFVPMSLLEMKDRPTYVVLVLVRASLSGPGPIGSNYIT